MQISNRSKAMAAALASMAFVLGACGSDDDGDVIDDGVTTTVAGTETTLDGADDTTDLSVDDTLTDPTLDDDTATTGS